MTATVDRVLDITINDVTIGVSPEHPFWDLDSGWTAAGSLREGSGLYGGDREPARVRQISRRPEDEHTVHNITVAGAHTYLVSDLRILVRWRRGRRPCRTSSRTCRVLVGLGRPLRRSAEAQPPGHWPAASTIRRLREIQKAIDNFKRKSNALNWMAEDLSTANGIDNDLHPDRTAAAGTPRVEPTPTDKLTADGAFRPPAPPFRPTSPKNPGREHHGAR